MAVATATVTKPLKANAKRDRNKVREGAWWV